MKQLIVPQTGNPSNDKVKSFDSLVRSCKALKQGQKKFLLDLTEEQKEVVIDDSIYCLVKSAAGSGKMICAPKVGHKQKVNEKE